MREIKYDAIYKPTGEHFEPTGLDFQNYSVRGNFGGEINYWCHFSLDGKFGDAIIRQYTGLKDKNGVEIYEGEVIDVQDHGYPFFKNWKGIVKMIDGCWMIENFEGTDGEPLFDETRKIEIIGNIYSNPELLER